VGTVRIVAGFLKGRRLRVPPGGRVRPTAERVREALFSILGGAVSGLEVLDAYAGSGAVGFEALSRGARRVTFLEADARAVEAIREAARRFGVADRVVVLRGDVERLLLEGDWGGPFDFVFSDPPYVSGRREAFLRTLSRAGRVRPGGLVVLERDSRAEPTAARGELRLFRTARYGRTCLDFYRAESP
jgi:16S rRNA (guanine(966)-N(2))-methyltransferase RsmD